MRKLLLLVFVLALAVVGAGLYLLFTPYGPSTMTFVDIPSGTFTREIARMLTDAGVVRSEYSFLAARVLHPHAVLQAGEYGFDHPMNAADVYRKIVRGDIFYYEVTIPEGANMFDIAGALSKLGIMKPNDFLKVARQPDLIKDVAPSAPNLEGYLFPATYRVTRHTTARMAAQDMTMRFRKAWKELSPGEVDVNRLVTLASLVEKETAAKQERPVVASVYVNRLRLGMKLDCDPTTIYAAMLEGRYRGVIHRSDLDNPSPYNTYRNPGLPPGPIANPGMASLQASLRPAQTQYVYFVAKPNGSGEHHFSASIAEHNVAVAEYRRGEARR